MPKARLALPALLLIACSQRKSAVVRRGRAWNVYDGQLYRVLKNTLAALPGWPKHLCILIVSARYGVITPNRIISTYDERLTRAAARERATFWSDTLHRAVRGRLFRAVHVSLGREYLRALPNLKELFRGFPLSWAHGGIGSRNAQTRKWVLDRLAESQG